MVGFKEAIKIAEKNLTEIQDSASDIRVEQALIADNFYEITLSYKVVGEDGLSAKGQEGYPIGLGRSIGALLDLPSFGRIYKTFLIDKKDGVFKGFKAFKEA